ncbi:MAG: EscU/YscU/HrcU family type III secretion system export apparatus switch protein [Burkholderiales bacterium]|nr:EscU/YscU/HrcU family type III secretion system export apparatus switch protein [Burkholderiales bacterium]
MPKPSRPARNAVALAYQTGDAAPRVVAKGKGLIAEEIIARAREHGIHVHQSDELVSLLMKVDLDRDIPPALYRAVAELLAWLYHIDTEKSERLSGATGQDQVL